MNHHVEDEAGKDWMRKRTDKPTVPGDIIIDLRVEKVRVVEPIFPPIRRESILSWKERRCAEEKGTLEPMWCIAELLPWRCLGRWRRCLLVRGRVGAAQRMRLRQR